MKTICLYFQVHQPYRLRRYRFFDIGNNHYYYDDFTNRSIMQKIAYNCYLPANEIMLDLIKQHGKNFKISYSISGTAIEQFQQYAPDVLESFKALADTGQVEFLAETYSHTLAALKGEEEFKAQVKAHAALVKKLFGQEPTVFRNTELVYSDHIGQMVTEMGYKAMLTEGAKHILGWKSPNYLYHNPAQPELKLLLRNHKLSDDIAFRFSNRSWLDWPLTSEKFTDWLSAIPQEEKIINLFMDYETFGEHQSQETGIFEFLKAFPATVLARPGFEFATPSEVAAKYEPKAEMHVPYPISWADEERDLSAWVGNELQDEAFNNLYAIKPLVDKISDQSIQHDWKNLQTSDHFYYMCTKFFSDGAVHNYFNPYSSPYDAFINYMNVLSDFIEQVKTHTELTEAGNEDQKKLEETEKLLEESKAEIERLKQELKKNTTEKAKKAAKKSEAAKKATGTKTATKKAGRTTTGTKKKKTTAKKATSTKKKKAEK